MKPVMEPVSSSKKRLWNIMGLLGAIMSLVGILVAISKPTQDQGLSNPIVIFSLVLLIGGVILLICWFYFGPSSAHAFSKSFEHLVEKEQRREEQPRS